MEYQGFVGKFFLAKPRSSSGYALAADKKQLRVGAGNPFASTVHMLLCWTSPTSSVKMLYCVSGTAGTTEQHITGAHASHCLHAFHHAHTTMLVPIASAIVSATLEKDADRCILLLLENKPCQHLVLKKERTHLLASFSNKQPGIYQAAQKGGVE